TAAPQPAAGPPASSRYYTKEGKLLTGGQPTPSPEDDATRPGLERMSLDEEWATLARSHLLESTEPPPPPPSPTPTRAERSQLLLSDDTQRAYRIKRRLGQGTQGIVYEVEVLGRQDFPAFLRPVERAVIKRAKEAAAVNAERLIYSQIDYRVVKLLDHGLDSKERPYLVLERLRATPHERYRGPEGRGRIPVDPASAVELFVNLLDRVKGLHFRRKLPLVLCDIKPANVMLRMPSAEPLDDEAYLTRLAEGRYEPVFVDLGCAQHREVLREAQGRLRGLIGSPMFLPPESIPRPGAEGELIPGIYGPQTDVYALTLTFYEWISGVRAYQHLEHEWKNDEDPLLALFELKHRGADPVDAATLTGRVGSNAQPVLEILRAGLHPDPRQRATTNKLFELASKAFQLQVWKRDKRPYAFDDAQNHLTWRQGLFPRLSLERNGYKRATVVEA
ncbi:MAG TPA: hypothetical protein DEA08_28590, partial [Planctomycetes bacterium]|nr:hypothetical protein [Planctomycetota bacterium]